MNRNNIINRGFRLLREKGVLALVRHSLIFIEMNSILCPQLPFEICKLKKLRTCDIDELVSFCFSGAQRLIRPGQVREEITDLLEEVKKEEPRVVIEIGTAMGGTLFLFCRAAAEIATIISIDLPGGEFGGGYSSLRIPLYKAFKLPKQRIHLIRADSHKEATLQHVKRVLNGEKADLLFIDGDHSYNGIKMDFEMFSPLVKDGGLIALHDIVLHPAATGCEVNRFWEEIKSRYEYTEFVSDWNQGWAGIGTIRWRI